MHVTPTVGRTNGHAPKFDVLKLGDTTEERRPVEINGRTLMAWVTTNGRYPTSIAAELDDARNRWLATRQPIDPNAAMPSTLWDAAAQLAELFVDGEAVDAEAVMEAAHQVARVIRALEDEPEMRSSEVDWQRYLTRSLCQLIPGLEDYEADLLSPTMRLMALRQLGYLRAGETPTAGKDEEDGEGDEDGAENPPNHPNPQESEPSSTGAEPEPDSAATTE